MDKFTYSKQVGRVPEYKVPLSKSEEERALALHDRSVVFDLRMGGGMITPNSWEQLSEWEYWSIYLPETHRFGYEAIEHGGITAFGTEIGGMLPALSKIGWRFDDMVMDLGLYLEDINKNSDKAIPGLRAEDVRRAKKEGKFAVFFIIENSEHIYRDLDKINALHGLGIRVQMLAYNAKSYVADGRLESSQRTTGLTDFGHEYVKRMNEVGMLIDATHAGEMSTIEAAKVSKSPISVSHTGARKLHNTPRLASDEELHAVAEGGGILGVHAGPNILSNDKKQGVWTVVDHMEYIANLVGIDHVGLGTDNVVGDKNTLNKFLVREDKAKSAYIGSGVDQMKGISDPSQEKNITRELVKRGYSDGEIQKILGLNALRVYERAVG